MKTYHLFICILLCFSAVVYSCENASVAQESTATESTATESMQEPKGEVASASMAEEVSATASEPAMDYTIEDQRAGDFKVGGAITTVAEEKGYTLEKRTMMAEGSEEPFYLVFAEGEPLLRITPNYNLETEQFEDAVGRIMVLSTRYKMANGLGKGSTIKELQETYTDVSFSYTYVGGFYYANTKQSSVQFVLSDADFTGTKKANKSDSVLLNAADFKQEGKIAGIRIF
ncbi:MAG: hypothetical protein AB8E82_00315 [Aureispira sp.]